MPASCRMAFFVLLFTTGARGQASVEVYPDMKVTAIFHNGRAVTEIPSDRGLIRKGEPLTQQTYLVPDRVRLEITNTERGKRSYVIVEGEAKIEVKGRSNVDLLYGWIQAKLDGFGLQLQLHRITLAPKGTDFDVRVDLPTGDARVTVWEGSVLASARIGQNSQAPQPRIVLSSGTSAAFEAGRLDQAQVFALDPMEMILRSGCVGVDVDWRGDRCEKLESMPTSADVELQSYGSIKATDSGNGQVSWQCPQDWPADTKLRLIVRSDYVGSLGRYRMEAFVTCSQKKIMLRFDQREAWGAKKLCCVLLSKPDSAEPDWVFAAVSAPSDRIDREESGLRVFANVAARTLRVIPKASEMRLGGGIMGSRLIEMNQIPSDSPQDLCPSLDGKVCRSLGRIYR